MHKLLRVGMRVKHGEDEEKRPFTLVRFIERWHGEYVWYVREDDGREHIEVFGLNDYIAQHKEAA